MTPSEARNAITARYLNVYNGVLPIALDNLAFTKPNPQTNWVRVNVRFNTGSQTTLGATGNRKFIKTGLLIIQIFTPINTATDENDSLANASLNLFDGERLGELWLYNGLIKTIDSGDGEYYQQQVIVEFSFESIR